MDRISFSILSFSPINCIMLLALTVSSLGYKQRKSVFKFYIITYLAILGLNALKAKYKTKKHHDFQKLQSVLRLNTWGGLGKLAYRTDLCRRDERKGKIRRKAAIHLRVFIFPSPSNLQTLALPVLSTDSILHLQMRRRWKKYSLDMSAQTKLSVC